MNKALKALGTVVLVALFGSACSSSQPGSGSTSGDLATSVELLTGVENDDYSRCLLDELTETGLSETQALETIAIAFSETEFEGQLRESSRLAIIGCLADLPAGLRSELPSFPDQAETEVADASSQAAAYGDDPFLDALMDACRLGSDSACFDLWWESPAGSEYVLFADTCGGRCESGAHQYSGQVLGSNRYLDGLVYDCEDGRGEACAELFMFSDVGSEYERLADTCAGRCPDAPFSAAGARGDNPHLDELYDECSVGDDYRCFLLYWYSFGDTEYGQFGDTCGGRCEVGRFSLAMQYGENAYLDQLWDECELGVAESCVLLSWGASPDSSYAQFGWERAQ